jgi:ABC-type multidrug transport system fused ATPase/permease subunit
MDTTTQPTDNSISSKETKNLLLSILFEFVKEHPVMIPMYAFFVTVIVLQDVVLPHFSGKVVNAISKKSPIIKPFLIVMGITLTIQVLSTITDYYDYTLWPAMQAYFRQKILAQVFETYRENFSDIDTAYLLTKVSRLPYTFFTFMDQMRYIIFPQLIVYVIAVCYISTYDFNIAAALTILVIFIIFVMLFSPGVCEKYSYPVEKSLTRLSSELDDIFNNLMAVFSYNKETREKQYIDVFNQEYIRLNLKTVHCALAFKTAVFPAMLSFTGYFLYRCHKLSMGSKATLDAGRFVSLFMTTFFIMNSCWSLLSQIREVVPRWGRIKENLQIFAKIPKHNNVNTIALLPNPPTGLLLHQLSYRYLGANVFTLENINLYVPPGDRVCITGKIGSGKSTLVQLIMGFKKPTHGHIYLGNRPYESYSIFELRRAIGYVSQYPILFNRTIYENIIYGARSNPPPSKDDVMEMLHKYGIQDIFDNHPYKLDSKAGRKGFRLSGGQRQIVWILRMILSNPDLIVLDEPTASLDDGTKDIVFKMLDIAIEGKTTIMVSHDPRLISRAKRVVLIQNKTLIEATQPPKNSFDLL